MKRQLTEIKSYLESAIKRLEDLGPVFPSAGLAAENVCAVDLRPALEATEYRLQLTDD